MPRAHLHNPLQNRRFVQSLWSAIGEAISPNCRIRDPSFPRQGGLILSRGSKMLGDLINRVLLMLLGYAYPAFECYKCLENSNVDVEELLFWCRFWIVVAVYTAFEWVGDTFIFWLPFYGEAKVAAFVCLWYPGIKATSHVYGNLLLPQLQKYEPEIDKKIMELKERAWGYVVLHWHRVFAMAQSTMFQFLAAAGQNKSGKQPPTPRASPAPPPSSRSEASTPPKQNPGKTHFADGTEALKLRHQQQSDI